MPQNQPYDVFLSYAHEDLAWVEQLAFALDERGLAVWFDRWVLVPGALWQSEMTRGLDQARSCVVCIGDQTPRGRVRQEIHAALSRQAADPEFRVIILLLPGACEEAVEGSLSLQTKVDLRAGLDDREAFQRLVARIKGVPPGRKEDLAAEQAAIRAREEALEQARARDEEMDKALFSLINLKPVSPGKSAVRRRIYVSVPHDAWLTPNERRLKWFLVAMIRAYGYQPLIYVEIPGTIWGNRRWEFASVDNVMRQCVGAVVLALPRWKCSCHVPNANSPKAARWFTTEYAHYEGAVALTLGLPTLILLEKWVQERGIVDDRAAGNLLTYIPQGSIGPSWLTSAEFRAAFDDWMSKLESRRDVFLGYSSSSTETAQNIKQFLEGSLGATVLDWKEFAPAGTILERIVEAGARCSAGIFLFTKDDGGWWWKRPVIPRDNVIFEAGYFVHAKGKARTLIVREKGAKMPSDLGGDIYAQFNRRPNIEPIKDQLRAFIGRL